MYLMNDLCIICHNFMFHESSGSPFAMLLGDGRCISMFVAPPGYGGNLGCFVSFRTSWHFGRSGGCTGAGCGEKGLIFRFNLIIYKLLKQFFVARLLKSLMPGLQGIFFDIWVFPKIVVPPNHPF